MATSVKIAGQHLCSLGVAHEIVSESCLKPFIVANLPTLAYCDTENRLQLRVTVHIVDEGQCVLVAAPLDYSATSIGVRGRLALLMLKICKETLLFQAEMDEGGDVALVAEVAVMDTEFTAIQLKRLLRCLVEVVDKYDAEIRRTVADVEVDS